MNNKKPPLTISYEYLGGEENRITEVFNFMISKVVEEWRNGRKSYCFIQEGNDFVELESTSESLKKSLLTKKGNIIYAYL